MCITVVIYLRAYTQVRAIGMGLMLRIRLAPTEILADPYLRHIPLPRIPNYYELSLGAKPLPWTPNYYEPITV